MSFYVEIRNGKIIAKLEAEYVPNDAREYKKISRELYESIGLTPCSFEEVDGEIVDVEHIPLPPPPPPEPDPIEQLRIEQAQANTELFELVLTLIQEGAS